MQSSLCTSRFLLEGNLEVKKLFERLAGEAGGAKTDKSQSSHLERALSRGYSGVFLLGQGGYWPAGATCCTQIREEPLLIILMTLDLSFKLGSNSVSLMRVGVRGGGSEIPGVLLL